MRACGGDGVDRAERVLAGDEPADPQERGAPVEPERRCEVPGIVGVLGRQGAGGLQHVEESRPRPDHSGLAERLGLAIVRAGEQVAGDASAYQPVQGAVAPRAGRFAVVLDDDGGSPVQRTAQTGQQRHEAETMHVHHIGL